MSRLWCKTCACLSHIQRSRCQEGWRSSGRSQLLQNTSKKPHGKKHGYITGRTQSPLRCLKLAWPKVTPSMHSRAAQKKGVHATSMQGDLPVQKVPGAYPFNAAFCATVSEICSLPSIKPSAHAQLIFPLTLPQAEALPSMPLHRHTPACSQSAECA